MSTTTLTPITDGPRDGPLSTSYFGTMPTIPSIRQTSTASWPTVNGTIPRPTALQLNKIYFNKKILKESVQRYNPNTLQSEVAQIWEIPFSVDVEIPVTELTQRIQAVMTAKKIYRNWDINMNTFLITASQVTSEWDTIR
jgi:hypothetical protein